MIISDDQVRLAYEYLQATGTASLDADDSPPGVPEELLERVRSRLADSPDVRFDRVAEARRALELGVSNEEVASKIVGRIISDSIR